ncbi:MAG: hypothetical protein ACE5F5_07355 [Acidimicrobiia bacterium]
MTDISNPWQSWLAVDARHFPRTINEALPKGLLPHPLVLENNPLLDPIDATGHLSLGRLEILIEAVGSEDDTWMVGYWDGWSQIVSDIERGFAEKPWKLHMPDRAYVCVETKLSQVLRFSHEGRTYVGPSLLAPADESFLLLSDVDWPVSITGFLTPRMRDEARRVFAQHGIPTERTCDAERFLSHYLST